MNRVTLNMNMFLSTLCVCCRARRPCDGLHPERKPQRVAALHVKKINRSHTHTHTDREQHPRHRHTRTRQEQHPTSPNEDHIQALNDARRWRDDGACHLPRPGAQAVRGFPSVRGSLRGWGPYKQRIKYGILFRLCPFYE